MESPIAVIVTVTSTLIGALSPIIVALIQSRKKTPEKSSGILLPDKITITQNSRTPWLLFILLAVFGGFIGYGISILIISMPSASIVSYDGNIAHDPNGGLRTYAAGVQLENFETQVDFFVPSNVPDTPWNFAFFFRTPGSVIHGYRIWVDAKTNSWGYSFWDGSGYQFPVNIQPLPDNLLLLKEGEMNSIRLVAYKDKGCFYLNEQRVSQLGLSAIQQAGDIAIGIDGNEYQFEGGVTRFTNFSIRKISKFDCSE